MVTVAMIVCVLTYTVVASFGYLTFGSTVDSDILLSYPQSVPVLVAVILIALKMYTTYPILLFVGRYECNYMHNNWLCIQEAILQYKCDFIVLFML